MRHLHCMLMLAATLLSLPGYARDPLQHEQFAQRQQKIKTIAVVPADVAFNLDTVADGMQRDAAREDQIRAELRATAEAQIASHGYKVDASLAARMAAGDQNLAFEFEQFKQRYVGIANESRRRNPAEDGVALVKTGVGPQAIAWAANSGVDALLLVRYQGFSRSGGKVFVDSIPGVLLGALTGIGYAAKKSDAYLEAVLIDAVSGEVLWFNDTGEQKNVFFSSRMTPAKMLAYSLKPLPRLASPILPSDVSPASPVGATPQSKEVAVESMTPAVAAANGL